MTKQEALSYFEGSPRRLAQVLGISVQSVHQWRSDRIPRLREYEIRELQGSKAK